MIADADALIEFVKSLDDAKKAELVRWVRVIEPVLCLPDECDVLYRMLTHPSQRISVMKELLDLQNPDEADRVFINDFKATTEQEAERQRVKSQPHKAS